MIHRTLTILTCLIAVLMSASGAQAQSESQGTGGWALSIGQFDIARDEQPIEGGIEYRFGQVELWSLPLTPMVGVSATEDGAAWVYGGMRYDFELSDRWLLTPNFAVSLYDEGDDGKDLGHVVEFRSGLEISYRLTKKPGGPRLGLIFYHLSNASISATNPGSNSLALTFAFGRRNG